MEPVWRPIPPISGDEASTSHPDLGALVDRLDGKNSDGLNNYLLEALALSNNKPENTSPPFVRRTWLHLVENLRQLKPDVLVFANARGPVGPHFVSGRAARGTVREARDGAAEFVAPALGFGPDRGAEPLRGIALLRAGRCT